MFVGHVMKQIKLTIPLNKIYFILYEINYFERKQNNYRHT